MALTLLAANNAQTVLAAGINSSATTMTVNTGTGALFPTPSAGANYFKLTLIDAATGLLNEIVHVTARTGDTMTIVRAQEGTTARAWSANDIAANMMTAGSFSGLAQLDTAEFLNATTGRLLNVRTFTSSGTYTPTAGTKFVVVEAIGGGGAGGGAPATAASSVSVGGGGTAGSYGKSIYFTGFSGVTVTIGSGGSPASGTGGGAGGSTSFGSLLVCSGGGGGLSQGPSSPGFGPLGSPAGGAVTGANIFWSPGEPGGYSFTATGVVCPGIGASSKMGSGGTLNTINSNGTSGNGYGAGGSGAGNNISQTAKSGGPGSGGIVVVWEYA
ncbi:hypothetical protein [Enterobacter sp. BNK-8]|uniref:hypothetical protein n=1 Tax=Enterobacter sp. BNK-8 TaxID=3376145 RepID=UPI003B50579D